MRTRMQQMELLLPQFQEACEQQANQHKRKAVVAMDETFFGDFLILVLMDLSSGYLLMEDISDDRRFETWYAKPSPRLEALGIEVSHAISDRAKALIKLAVTGFECDSGADLFHAQQDLSRWLGPKLASQAATGVDLFVRVNIIIRLFFSKWNYILWQFNFFDIRLCQNIPTVIK